MSQVLVISWAFPPILDTESLQTLRCVKHLPAHGWQPMVLTVKPPQRTCAQDTALLGLVPSDLRVERAWTWEHRLTVGLLRRVAPALLELPDKEVGWLWDAVRRGRKLIAQENVRVIYSRACPFSSLLIGYRLKQLTGLPWVAHFSDPWVDSPYFKPRNARHRRFHETWERRIVTTADALTFATGYIRDGFVTKYPAAEKSFIVSNSFDLSEIHRSIGQLVNWSIGQNEPMNQLTDVSFVLTHVGQFYGIRSPVPFLRALRQAIDREPLLGARVRVRFVGNQSLEFQRVVDELQLNNAVTVTGSVPYFESLRHQAAADALLLVDAPCDGASVFLPSKLLEYLAFGKPILALTPRRGMSAGLVAQAGGVVVPPDDVEGIAQRIVEMWRQFERGQLSGHRFFPQSCESAQVAGALADALRRVASPADPQTFKPFNLQTFNCDHAHPTENLEGSLPLQLP
jgi:glycosyltransferase involved in cell wall biosynthesis